MVKDCFPPEAAVRLMPSEAPLYDRPHIGQPTVDCGSLVNIGPKVHVRFDHDDKAASSTCYRCYTVVGDVIGATSPPT